MNLKEVKKYVSDAIEGYFKPKVLKKFDETTSGVLTYDGDPAIGLLSISGKSDNAVELLEDTTNTSNSGLYVKDLSEEVKKINIAQKTVNELGYDELLESVVKLPTINNATTLGDAVKTTLNVDINLLKSINDYEYIDVYLKPSNEAGRGMISQCTRIKVKDIIFNNTNTANLADGSQIICNYSIATDGALIGGASHFPFTGWFKNDKTFHIDTMWNPLVANVWSKFQIQSIQGIKKETITIDPINYLDTTQGIQDTPVGHIMSIMGNNAPEHYLKCDGTIYNKDDYPHLWEYFKKEFGTPNKFGGNGTTTFAVPDLRDEFLRGAGTLSGNVGEHQEGTIIPNMGINYDNSDMAVRASKTVSIANVEDVKKSGTLTYNNVKITKSAMSGQTWEEGTVRPRNTSVLWVIKYEPTYFVGSINGKEEIDELLDTPYLVSTVGDSRVDLQLSKSIEDYDYLEIEHCLPYNIWDLCNRTDRIKVSDITYNTSTINQAPNPIFKDSWTLINVELNNFTTSLEIGFRNATTLYIYRHVFNKTISTTAFRGTKIKAVRGIKTIYAPDKAIGGGTGTVEPEPTDAEIQTAITETITELNK